MTVDVEDQREEACEGKVGVAKFLAVYAEYCSGLQIKRLAQREKTFLIALGKPRDSLVFWVMHGSV